MVAANNAEDIARARERIAELIAEVSHLKLEATAMRERVKALETKVTEYDRLSHKWRGAFALVIGFGAFLGWLASVFPKFK